MITRRTAFGEIAANEEGLNRQVAKTPREEVMDTGIKSDDLWGKRASVNPVFEIKNWVALFAQ
jgi:hypothetical protein